MPCRGFLGHARPRVLQKDLASPTNSGLLINELNRKDDRQKNRNILRPEVIPYPSLGFIRRKDNESSESSDALCSSKREKVTEREKSASSHALIRSLPFIRSLHVRSLRCSRFLSPSFLFLSFFASLFLSTPATAQHACVCVVFRLCSIPVKYRGGVFALLSLRFSLA